MKKIEAIMKGKKFIDKLFGNKQRCIYRALDDALDNIERQKINAENDYLNNLSELADDNANYKYLINKMISNRQTILNADETIKVINFIKEDLNSEVEDVSNNNE